MALVASGWQLIIDWVDRGGKSTTSTLNLVTDDDAGDASQVFTDAGVVRTALAAGSDLVIAGYSVKKRFVNDALTLPTAGTAEKEAKAHLVGKIDGDPFESGVFDLPGPKDTMFLDTSGDNADIVDVAHDPALSIIETFQPTGLVTISDGEHWVTATVKGKRIHKGSTKG